MLGAGLWFRYRALHAFRYSLWCSLQALRPSAQRRVYFQRQRRSRGGLERNRFFFFRKVRIFSEKRNYFTFTFFWKRFLKFEKSTRYKRNKKFTGGFRPMLVMWFLSNSSCWLHLLFCSLRCWFCCSNSLSLLVTHSFILAAFASTCLASWSRNCLCKVIIIIRKSSIYLRPRFDTVNRFITFLVTQCDTLSEHLFCKIARETRSARRILGRKSNGMTLSRIEEGFPISCFSS